MALDPTAMGYLQRAVDASKAAAGAEQAEQAHEDAMLRARSAKNVHNYRALIAMGQLDAWRQKRYLESGRTLDHYKSMRAFFKYLQEKLKTDEIAMKTFMHNVGFFWTLLFAYGPLELKDGATIARGALDKANWTTSVQGSKFAELSTLDYVLNGGLADGFLTELCKQGHGVETLDRKAKAMLNGTTDAPARKKKAPAKKPPAKKKKAPARRPRPEYVDEGAEDDDDDAYAPPPPQAEDDTIHRVEPESGSVASEVVALKKKLAETETDRDAWKEKYLSSEKKCVSWRNECYGGWGALVVLGVVVFFTWVHTN